MALDDKSIDAAAEIFKQVGFPAIVACWFMFRTDARLDAVRRSLDALTVALGGKPPPSRKKKIQEDGDV